MSLGSLFCHIHAGCSNPLPATNSVKLKPRTSIFPTKRFPLLNSTCAIISWVNSIHVQPSHNGKQTVEVWLQTYCWCSWTRTIISTLSAVLQHNPHVLSVTATADVCDGLGPQETAFTPHWHQRGSDAFDPVTEPSPVCYVMVLSKNVRRTAVATARLITPTALSPGRIRVFDSWPCISAGFFRRFGLWHSEETMKLEESDLIGANGCICKWKIWPRSRAEQINSSFTGGWRLKLCPQKGTAEKTNRRTLTQAGLWREVLWAHTDNQSFIRLHHAIWQMVHSYCMFIEIKMLQAWWSNTARGMNGV